MKRRIIINDPDRRNNRLIKNLLNAIGYEVTQCYSLSDCYTLVSLNSPDLIITDINPQESEGLKTLKRLRELGNFTVIALSELGGEKAITETLNAGADDYIKKPFLSGELIARVAAAIRRTERFENALGLTNDESYKYKGLLVEYDRHNIILNGIPIHLTKNEFKILTLLCRYSGRVLTYDFIIKSVWGHEALGGNGILRVNVTNLRKKFSLIDGSTEYITTENGVGYRIAESEEIS